MVRSACAGLCAAVSERLVLPRENQDRRANGQPLFTDVDDFGRLLNQYITPIGNPDKPWVNPTEFVWNRSGYQTRSAEIRYGLNVQQFVRQRCLPGVGSAPGTGLPAGTGAAPGAGGGVDWNNPWLDPRVQDCVRQYLKDWVLPRENQDRRANGQPLFTDVDDFGRLLNQYITPIGNPDKPWVNPTEFVWNRSGYQTRSAEIRYGLNVQQFVRQRCLPGVGSAPGTGLPAGTGAARVPEAVLTGTTRG